jgi:hypothetical protein
MDSATASKESVAAAGGLEGGMRIDLGRIEDFVISFTR